jgi:hypothetical protein
MDRQSRNALKNSKRRREEKPEQKSFKMEAQQVNLLGIEHRNEGRRGGGL